MGKVTNYVITSNSCSYPGSDLRFIGEIFFISLTVLVSFTRSIGIVDIVRATKAVMRLSVIDVRSTDTFADVRATEGIDATVSSTMIAPSTVRRYLPIS